MCLFQGQTNKLKIKYIAVSFSTAHMSKIMRTPIKVGYTTRYTNCQNLAIIKFIDHKLPKCLLQVKKTISSLNYNHLNIAERVQILHCVSLLLVLLGPI